MIEDVRMAIQWRKSEGAKSENGEYNIELCGRIYT
jgi:hypothetical protein